MIKNTKLILTIFIFLLVPVPIQANEKSVAEILPDVSLLLNHDKSRYGFNRGWHLRKILQVFQENIDFKDIEKLVGEKIITNGDKHKLGKPYQESFNHYNPVFFTKLSSLFEKYKENKTLKQLYTNYFKDTARFYFYNVKLLKHNPQWKQQYKQDYEKVKLSNKRIWLPSESSCRDWTKDYWYIDFEKGRKERLGNQGRVAITFWLRREIDGSYYELMSFFDKVIFEYDTYFYNRLNQQDFTKDKPCDMYGDYVDLDIPPTEKIESVLKKYVQTYGCLVSFNRDKIVKYNRRYVALYSVDPSCAGGSQSSQNAIAVFTYSYPDVHIVPGESFPSAPLFGFPRSIDKIFVKNNQLWYSGKKYNWDVAANNDDIQGDALCCPSVLVESQFSLVRKKIKDHKYAQEIKSQYGYTGGVRAFYWIGHSLLQASSLKSSTRQPEVK
jgi:hypothetical protein